MAIPANPAPIGGSGFGCNGDFRMPFWRRFGVFKGLVCLWAFLHMQAALAWLLDFIFFSMADGVLIDYYYSDWYSKKMVIHFEGPYPD